MNASNDIAQSVISPKAMLFDLDNTLTHRRLSIERYARRFLVQFHHALNATSLTHLVQLIKAADNEGYLPPDSGYSSIREAIAETLSQRLSWRSAQTPAALSAHWVEHVPSATVPMPGACRLMQVLAAHGVICGVVSDGAERSRRRTLEALPFAPAVRTLVSSETFGSAKPDPAIFLATADQLGVEATHCCFVGDHPVNDYQGARAAGMQAIWLRGFNPWPRGWEPAVSTVDTLYALPNLLMERR